MGDIPLPLIFNFFLFLSVPFVFGYLARKIKVSPLIGYIIGGLVLGNIFPELSQDAAIRNFAYFGIVLLLFTVGLETNFTRMLTLKKYIILGGTLQIILSILAVTAVSLLFKFPPLISFLIGIALSSSSTTIVAKIIQDRGEEASFIGEIAMGILIFQDIAFIPFLIIFTSITTDSLSFLNVAGDIVVGLLEATIIIGLLFFLGGKIIPRIFNRIARGSRELFNLFIIIFIFFVAGLSIVLKIPVLIGVFVAGILLATTIEHHQIFSQVRPIRDLLGVIFFVFIGSNIQLTSILAQLPIIIIFTFAVILVKALILLAIFLGLRFHSKTSFALSSYLFQIDEDAFILMSYAFLNNVVPRDVYLFVITSVLITLVATPIFIQGKDRVYQAVRRFIRKYLRPLDNFLNLRIDSNRSPIDALAVKHHIVICGYGRIGSYIGRSLIMANIPYVAIDYNLFIVEKARRSGVNIIYGDPTDIDILDYAQVEEAIILVLAVPESHTQEAIVLNAKKLNRGIYIISRVHREADQSRMRDLGVNLVIQPEFEASLSIIKKIYLWHNMEKGDIVSKIKRLKIEHGLG